MQNLAISEKYFKINKLEYHLKLIPTKHYNEKNSSFFTKLGLALSEVYFFSKIKGKVECEKKMWGPLSLKKLKKWKKMGRFSEEWCDSIEECRHYLTIKLTKERPKKIILIEDIDYDDFGRIELNKILIEKIGRENKRSPLEEIK